MAKRKSRVYWKRGRAYGDFRDLGGGLEALKPVGEKRATTDADVAAKLASDRVTELEAEKREKQSDAKALALGIKRQQTATLAWYSARHLNLKEDNEEVVPSWITQTQRHLQAAVDYFGGGSDIGSLSPLHMGGYVDHLRTLDNGRGGNLSDTSVRKYLNSLSNMFKRAVSEEYVPSNPVANMFTKPTENRVEAEYLEPEEAALLLESARTYKPPVEPVEQEHGGWVSPHANPWIYPILATFLLTGGRKSEVLGLEVDDVSFRLGKIYFRTNGWRRLKTKGSKRSVPLWPQLRETLEAYMLERERTGGLGSLLFPSEGGRIRSGNESGNKSRERMIRDLRKALDRIGQRAGFPAGHVRLHGLRHTYTAARIQTLDRGAPVALYSVARELGHSSTDMIEDRYGHLHDRAILGGSEEVEFRVEHHQDKIRDQLRKLAHA